MKAKEGWLEAGLFVDEQSLTRSNLLKILDFLSEDISPSSWHYFFEPNYEIRFRVYAEKKRRALIKRRIGALKRRKLINKVVYRSYDGEQAFYGKYGYEVAKYYFVTGAKVAHYLHYLASEGLLTSPIRKWHPLHFHLNRYVHLFANQLGYSVWDEFKWAIRYAWNRLIIWVKYRNMKVKGR